MSLTHLQAARTLPWCPHRQRVLLPSLCPCLKPIRAVSLGEALSVDAVGSGVSRSVNTLGQEPRAELHG